MMDAKIQEKIQQIQLVQQNLQNLSAQRQQFQLQQTEVDSALGEIVHAEKTFKIIGNIMVATDKDALSKDLEEKKQMLSVRISSIEKQESRLREKAEEIQKEVMKELENKDKNGKKA